MCSFVYPVRLKTDQADGGYVVTCRDLPEAITQGDSLAEALREAADCLDEAIHARMATGRDIPTPSRPRRGERQVALPVVSALKAALYSAVRESHLSKRELARRLGLDEKEARRMLDPAHPSKVPALERALLALGKQVQVSVA
jgi:antitoxin HicB